MTMQSLRPWWLGPGYPSDRCGMPYMVEEGRSGFLIDPLNIEQIADRVQKLLSSRMLCKQFGQRGREIASERFHPDVIAKKTIKVYQQVIKSFEQ